MRRSLSIISWLFVLGMLACPARASYTPALPPLIYATPPTGTNGTAPAAQYYNTDGASWVDLLTLPSSWPLPTGAATSANQTNGTQQTKVTDGTNIANVVAGDTGYNGINTGAATKSYTFTTTGTGAQILGPYNCEGFNTITFMTNTNGTSGLAFTALQSQTLTGTYHTNGLWQNCSTGGSIGGTLPAGTNYYVAPSLDNYFEVNITALTSGTWSGTITLSNRPVFVPYVNAAQVGGWTVQQGSTPSATPWLVQSSYSYTHISTNTTTTVKSSAGVLHTLVFGSAGAAETYTLYDNTAGSGTVIGVITPVAGGHYDYDCSFATGLTIVSAGTTSGDCTVSDR